MSNIYKKTSLPKVARQVIEQYYNLQIGGKKVVTPYFMNERKKKGRRVMVGKGTPAEIEKATRQAAQKVHFNLHAATSSQIREFMIGHEIGIDCSGFVVWVLHALTKERIKKPIWKTLDFSMLSTLARLKSKIRPVENISVRVLTHEKNSQRIDRIIDIAVGDMIRIFGGHHILLISEIIYGMNGVPAAFKYVNSTMYKDQLYGIRTGSVKIKDIKKYLVGQEWIDGEGGVNWIYDEMKNYADDSRIVRLKALGV